MSAKKKTYSRSYKSKKQKRQRKRRSLVLLLFLTIIMLGTSTYAWFTANRVVTINDINVNVQASDGIQISTDAVTWKSVITNADINSGYTGANNQLPSTMIAVSTAGIVDTVANSETKGKMQMFKATIDNGADDYVITTQADPETGIDYVAFDIFLRVSKNQTIYLTPDAKVINKADETDKGLKNAARVGFVNKGHAAANETTANLMSLNSPAGQAIIWEPNSDTHSDVVNPGVASDYGVTLGNPSTKYYGVKDALSTAADLKTFVRAGTAGGSSAYTTDMSTLGSNLVTTVNGTTAYTQIFTLSEGITKFRVYMWIEGQDIDCENNATGSNIIFKLQLSTDNGTNS